jgi:hypothetical protein
MGADKNSSHKRELGLYPKFTTNDSHTSFPRSSSHYGPTNPRNKPQTIPKRKHESRSKGLSNLAQCRADGPLPTGGRSVNCNRTTRCALQHTNGLNLVHGRSASKWCGVDGPRRPGGRSTKHLPAKNSWPTGSK